MQPTKAQRRFPLSELAAFFIAQKCHGKTGRRRQSEYSDCTVMAVATDFHRTSLLLWGKELNPPDLPKRYSAEYSVRFDYISPKEKCQPLKKS